MNQKLTLPSTPVVDDTLTPSDDAVRQALLRMGGGSQPARRSSDHASSLVSGDSRRRRFSQNENVPVEYVSRDRSAARHEAGRHESNEGPDPQTAVLGRALDRERQLREAAERALQDVKAQLQAAQTRLAHLEIDLEEARRPRIVPAAVPALAEPESVPEGAVPEAAVPEPAVPEASAPVLAMSEPVVPEAKPEAMPEAALAPEPVASLPKARRKSLQAELPIDPGADAELAARPAVRSRSAAAPAAEPEPVLVSSKPARPAPRPATRGRGRPRATPRVQVAVEDEPEPVKWWIKD